MSNLQVLRAAVVVSGVLALCKPIRADELLPNPNLANSAKGWNLLKATVLPDAKRGPSAVVCLNVGSPPGSPGGAIFVDVHPIPTDHELMFRASAKGTGTLGINVAAMVHSSDILLSDHKEVTLTGSAWQPVSFKFVAPRGSESVRLVLYNGSSKSLLVAQLHLETGEAKQPDPKLLRSLGGPGLIRAIERAPVRTEPGVIGTVTFPIPGDYRDQVPLAFKVKSTPTEALKGYKWRKRPDGLNWVCDVSVSTGPKGAMVEYESLVLVGDRPQVSPPKVSLPVTSDVSVTRWARSTACVQSADADVKAQAAELSKGVVDLETYARKVIAFTSTNKGTGAQFDALDAKKALSCGGSCTSRANLAAALLRARGIPARTVAHLPTWSGPLYEHWLVEYWHPGAGWLWLESTLGKWQPQPWTVAVINVANPEDEDLAFDALHLRYVMPGAPYSAVIELSKEVFPADGLAKDDATNVALPAARIMGNADEIAALIASAREAFKSLSERCIAGTEPAANIERLLTAVRSGKARDLAGAISPAGTR